MNREPQNTRSIRYHRARSGYEWQYWNAKVSRWSRYTKMPADPFAVRRSIAQWCYGCDPEQVTIVSDEGAETRRAGKSS
jgi:hypothetical protein